MLTDIIEMLTEMYIKDPSLFVMHYKQIKFDYMTMIKGDEEDGKDKNTLGQFN